MLDIDPPAAPEGITMKLEQVWLFLMSAVYFMGYTICMFIGIGFAPSETIRQRGFPTASLIAVGTALTYPVMIILITLRPERYPKKAILICLMQVTGWSALALAALGCSAI